MIGTKSMLLATTAIEETWGADEAILFLGEWCKLYERQHIWKERLTETLSDPWSDRERRFGAYQFTQKIYQNTIISLASALNEMHGVNYPVRHWKILCGPWLMLFINMLYHHWECIGDVIKQNLSLKTFVLNGKQDQYVPVDMVDFETMITSDQWNHHICSLIINEVKPSIESTAINNSESEDHSLVIFNQPRWVKRFLSNAFGYAGRLLNTSTSVFISNPYLSKLKTLWLGARLRSVPIISLFPARNRKYVYDNSLRTPRTVPNKPNTAFELFLNKIVLSHIPYLYAEGFTDLQSDVKDMKWQSNPSAILTATNHFSDDIFKCYAANKVMSGAKLKIVCHGGGGKMKYSDYQEFELDLCDRYFTWGWSEYSSKCTKGFFVKKNLARRNGNSKQCSLLHITLSQFRYEKFISSTPSYEQFVGKYINDQIQFLNKLTSAVKKEAITKLYYDLQNSVDKRILAKVPDVTFAFMGEDYLTLLKNARLVVATYNCTTFVETIAYNIPTIVFWDTEHWELAPSAQPFFEKMQACGVFHNNPASAALKINEIWNDVDAWWQSDEVVAACNGFRAWFCRESQEPIKELVDFCSAQ